MGLFVAADPTSQQGLHHTVVENEIPRTNAMMEFNINHISKENTSNIRV